MEKLTDNSAVFSCNAMIAPRANQRISMSLTTSETIIYLRNCKDGAGVSRNRTTGLKTTSGPLQGISLSGDSAYICFDVVSTTALGTNENAKEFTDGFSQESLPQEVVRVRAKAKTATAILYFEAPYDPDEL